jgi:hypothetical protein
LIQERRLGGCLSGRRRAFGRGAAFRRRFFQGIQALADRFELILKLVEAIQNLQQGRRIHGRRPLSNAKCGMLNAEYEIQKM